MVLSNEPPAFEDASGAVVSRFVTLVTRRSFLGAEDRSLIAKLEAELPGIVSWSLDGLRRLDERGKFTEPASSAATTEAMRQVVSPIHAFLDDCTVEGGTVARQELYEAWRAWCTRTGNRHCSLQQFGIMLRAARPMVGEARPRPSGGDRSAPRARVWTGLSLQLAEAS
jgi:putative DNA primase/helicase